MGEYAVGAATRRRIYEVAKRLFYEKGVKATSYTDICEAADVNRGLIPYYFKSKSNIAMQVLEEFVDSMEAAVDARWAPDEMVQPERNMMIELLMFRLLVQDDALCRFYSEMLTESAYTATTLRIQTTVMETLVSGAETGIDPASLRTVIAMVQGTENELVRLVYSNMLEESIESMVRRDIRCCFFLLDADMHRVDAWWDHVIELAEGLALSCDDRFQCEVVRTKAR